MDRPSDIDARLAAWLEEGPTRGPEEVLSRGLARVRSTRQDGGWRHRSTAPLLRSRPMGTMLKVGAVTAIIVVVGFVGLTLRPSGQHSVGGVQSVVPSVSPSVVIEQEELRPDVRLTSERFHPRVSFVLRAISGLHGETTDWCPNISTSERTLTLRWLNACREELRLTRPFAVDCGTPDEHPDATALAAAILRMDRVRDMGDLTWFAKLAPSFDVGGYTGRALLTGAAAEESQRPDQAGPCRLLPEPGTSDPTIEITGHTPGLTVLMDIDGELVVLQAPVFDGAPGALLRSFLSFGFIGPEGGQ